MPGNHNQIILECECCFTGCDVTCFYLGVGGSWVRVSTAPEFRDCEDNPECACTYPHIAPECDGQQAQCVCYDTTIGTGSTSGITCAYTVCTPEES